MWTRFCPWKVTSPSTISAGGERSRATANKRVDLPHPDSPTMPRNSPLLTCKLTRSTARTSADYPAYFTLRFLIVRMGGPPVEASLCAPARTMDMGSASLPGTSSPDSPQRWVGELIDRVIDEGHRGA